MKVIKLKQRSDFSETEFQKLVEVVLVMRRIYSTKHTVAYMKHKANIMPALTRSILFMYSLEQ